MSTDENKRTNNERLAVVETKIDSLKGDIKKIYDSVEKLSDTMNKKLSEHENYEERLRRLEKQSNLWRWLAPSLSAILASVVTFLVIQYIGSF